MITWEQFAAEAPRIATIFARRHAATGNLCMLATIRSDGSPRISPMEPGFVDGHLVLVGMPGTSKFADLERDPRFCLHTATVDTQVGDGDAKLWGRAVDLGDPSLLRSFAEAHFADTGFDLRGQALPFYAVDIASASSLELVGEALEITIWKPGAGERVVRKT